MDVFGFALGESCCAERGDVLGDYLRGRGEGRVCVREEGGELAADGGISVLLENDLLEIGGRSDLEATQLITIAAHTFAIWTPNSPGSGCSSTALL